jgi:hypothetical protein
VSGHPVSRAREFRPMTRPVRRVAVTAIRRVPAAVSRGESEAEVPASHPAVQGRVGGELGDDLLRLFGDGG